MFLNYLNIPRDTAAIFSVMPTNFREKAPSSWALANFPNRQIDSFIEGPCFDPDGNLYIVDIPFGRIFRIYPTGQWELIIKYDGMPNGLAWHPQHKLVVADYKYGLLALDPKQGMVKEILTSNNSQRFKGVNDLLVDSSGNIYFTDQGQTGLHDPSGCVYRYRVSGQLDCLLNNCPSPNGLALAREENCLFIAMTRDNSVWRAPLMSNGNVSKVGKFAQFYGPGGPDGLVFDKEENLLVAHSSLNCIFFLDSFGHLLKTAVLKAGSYPTNLTLDRDRQTLYITDSGSASIFYLPMN